MQAEFLRPMQVGKFLWKIKTIAASWNLALFFRLFLFFGRKPQLSLAYAVV